MKVLPAAERETTIRWDAEEKVAHIYTGDPVYIRKLDKLCEDHPDEYKLVKRDEYGARYTAPMKMIRFAKPLSDAQREAYSKKGANLAVYRAGQREKIIPDDSDE